jgi:hypothetical protein
MTPQRTRVVNPIVCITSIDVRSLSLKANGA